MKFNIRTGLLAAIGFVVIAQLVPYGRNHTNPSIAAEPSWNHTETRALFIKACRDCHSNETVWPWYSQLAPASWLVQFDVDEGRSHFNASEWGREHNEGDEAAEMIEKDEMPPWYYRPAHPEAQLTLAEKKQLIAGLKATFPKEAAEPHDHSHH